MNYFIISIFIALKKFKRFFNFIKFLFPKYLNVINVFFLRKTSTFIKSKYTKNRQWSKSIVYFGLWFGIISSYVITYYVYKFLFVFSYIWWVPAILLTTLTLTYVYKNRKYLNVSFIKIWL